MNKKLLTAIIAMAMGILSLANPLQTKAYTLIPDTNVVADVTITMKMEGLDSTKVGDKNQFEGGIDGDMGLIPVMIGYHKTGAKGYVRLTCEIPEEIRKTGNVTYRWYHDEDWSVIQGATGSTLTLFGPDQEIKDGMYVCDPQIDGHFMNKRGDYYFFYISDESKASEHATYSPKNDSSTTFNAVNGGPVSASSVDEYLSVPMFRLRNPVTGEHFFTSSSAERDNVVKAGWSDETPAGGAWMAPVKSSAPIYRLYNPNKKTCNHLYSMNPAEMANLTKAGWKVEGIAYYSDVNKGQPIYRLYNAKTGDHHYTRSTKERDQLASTGWKAEGVAWYGVQ